jgi:hypothetical protein
MLFAMLVSQLVVLSDAASCLGCKRYNCLMFNCWFMYFIHYVAACIYLIG